MKITRIDIVLRSYQTDVITYTMDFLDPFCEDAEPYTLSSQTPPMKAEEFVKKNFPNIPYFILDAR